MMYMKINFDWQNFMSKNSANSSKVTEDSQIAGRTYAGKESVYRKTFVDISEKATEGFKYGDQGRNQNKLNEAINSEDYVAVQRDFMTVMSNSMSASDFQKMKEEGWDVSKMEPEQVVTILDKIKTVLAQSGTYVQGYNDNLSVDKITEITGNSGYAENIAKELAYADAPVTEENINQIDEIVDQVLTMERPGEGSMAYMVSHQMEPTMENLYKAHHSSINLNRTSRMTGYASNAYSRQGTDTEGVRKTVVSQEDMLQIEKQIKNRIESEGLEVNSETVENGKWLLENGLPVTGKNIEILQNIKDVEFPLNIMQVIKQAARAVSEGKSPFQANLNDKGEGLYKEACNIYDRYQKISFQAVDYTVHNQMECSLKNMETYNPGLGYTIPRIEARKMLEEVRLKMTVEANVKLLRSGFQIETASMETLIKQLDLASKSLKEDLWGKEDADVKAELFAKTQGYLKELPSLPIAVVGKIPFMKKAILPAVVEEGRILQDRYEQAKGSYETIMTAPRADLGDSIRKAFRNVDDILQDMNLEINEANQRAIRIMGYNQITITEENLEKIKEADKQVRTIIEKLKPGMTLQMIRDGKNPLEMSMEEINSYISERENDFVNDTEKYSEFLYKLEKKKGISQAEREAYIGIYRLLRQVEKTDGAVVGSLLNQNADVSFSNLLSAVRTGKAKHTDVIVNDDLGFTHKVERKGASISEQIEKGILAVQDALIVDNSSKTPDQVLKEVQMIEKDIHLEKQLAETQLEELREALNASGKEKEYLESYQQPVTLENLHSSMVLNTQRGSTFKKVIELEDRLQEGNLENLENSILKEAEDFLSQIENVTVRNKAYDNIITHTKEVLEEAVKQRDLGYVDVKGLQSAYKQVSFTANLAKEENYEIPIQLGEEITSINLKIIAGSDKKGEVKITLETADLGKVEARFTETEDGLEGSVLTDYMDGKKLLEAHSKHLRLALTEALKETKTEVKSLFFGVNEKLDFNAIEKNDREENTDVSLLYKVAKEFIYYIKGIKEA